MRNLNDLHSQGADTQSGDPTSLPFTSSLDPTKGRQLQQQDIHISIIFTKCKSKKYNETLYYLDEHGIAYRKIKDGSNICTQICSPKLYNHTCYRKVTMY